MKGVYNYLNKYNIKCDYKKLNMYSLLRLYHEINRIKDFYYKDIDLFDIVLFELNMYGIYEDSSEEYRDKPVYANIKYD